MKEQLKSKMGGKMPAQKPAGGGPKAKIKQKIAGKSGKKGMR